MESVQRQVGDFSLSVIELFLRNIIPKLLFILNRFKDEKILINDFDKTE